jgi:hypothetical protein
MKPSLATRILSAAGIDGADRNEHLQLHQRDLYCPKVPYASHLRYEKLCAYSDESDE